MVPHDLPQGMVSNTISLLLGHPDPSTLLPAELCAAMQRVLDSSQAYTALQYGAEQGARSLIDVLVDKINCEQGLTIQAKHVMIVAGSTHAVDMLTRLYAKPRGVVLVEAPSYVDALHVFRDHHVELYAVPMDDDGLLPSALEQQLMHLKAQGKTASMLYTVPNFHNPTGRTLSEERRLQIIELARRYDFLIVEDDVYRDLAFEGAVPSSFYALAHGKQVVSIGSFSKTLAPGLRLGWLVGAEEIIECCVNCGTTQMGGGANPFAAQIVAEYCRSGHWQRHIQHLQALYKARCDQALAALERFMPSDVVWTRPAGGFFIWLTLPPHVFAQQVKQQALQRGVLVASGEGFFVDPSAGTHHLRLAYSCAAPDALESAIHTLAQVIRNVER